MTFVFGFVFGRKRVHRFRSVFTNDVRILEPSIGHVGQLPCSRSSSSRQSTSAEVMVRERLVKCRTPLLRLAVDILLWTCCATSCPTCCKTCCLFYNLLWTCVADLLLAFDLLSICRTARCRTSPQQVEANGVRH